jgi:integrase
MSKKYSNTTADYLEWSEAINLIHKLEKAEEWKMSLFVAVSIFFGLRVSDTLSLTWEQILGKDEFEIVEKKTKKVRKIKINSQLSSHIQNCYEHIKPEKLNDPILISQKGSVFSLQRLNVVMKEWKVKYKLNVKNFSCHSLRKSFGRQIYNQSGENAELALVKLSEILNHSSVAITRRYLGLRQEEISDAYNLLSF